MIKQNLELKCSKFYFKGVKYIYIYIIFVFRPSQGPHLNPLGWLYGRTSADCVCEGIRVYLFMGWAGLVWSCTNFFADFLKQLGLGPHSRSLSFEK